MPHVYATVHVRRSQTTVRMPRVLLRTHTTVDYHSGDTCATAHVCHSTTDRTPRALATRGHTRPRVHRTWLTDNLRALLPVDILQTPHLSFRYVPVAAIHLTPRFVPRLLPCLRAQFEDRSNSAQTTLPPSFSLGRRSVSPRLVRYGKRVLRCPPCEPPRMPQLTLHLLSNFQLPLSRLHPRPVRLFQNRAWPAMT